MRTWIPFIALLLGAIELSPRPLPRAGAHGSRTGTAVCRGRLRFDGHARPGAPAADHGEPPEAEHAGPPVAVQEIVGAIGTKDFPAISRAAATIGYSEQMGQMCTHMGAGASGFTEQALRFHHTADKIAEAARGRDMPGVLDALSATLTTCTGCHSVFKQRIVDETTWASLAGQSAPHHP